MFWLLMSYGGKNIVNYGAVQRICLIHELKSPDPVNSSIFRYHFERRPYSSVNTYFHLPIKCHCVYHFGIKSHCNEKQF